MGLITFHIQFSLLCAACSLGLKWVTHKRLEDNGWYVVVSGNRFKIAVARIWANVKLIAAHFAPIVNIAMPCVFLYMISHKRDGGTIETK